MLLRATTRWGGRLQQLHIITHGGDVTMGYGMNAHSWCTHEGANMVKVTKRSVTGITIIMLQGLYDWKLWRWWNKWHNVYTDTIPNGIVCTLILYQMAFCVHCCCKSSVAAVEMAAHCDVTYGEPGNRLMSLTIAYQQLFAITCKSVFITQELVRYHKTFTVTKLYRVVPKH